MVEPNNRNTEVLIVGAGPTGLVLALWLARLGVRIRIIDKTEGPGTTSRALAVQARTLEFYRQLGIADLVVERGRRVVAANLWADGRKAAHIFLGEIGRGISPFSYALIFPQDEHERLLLESLSALGIEVERRTELVDFQQTATAVQAQIRSADGAQDTCVVSYIAGCDGAHSIVRQTLGIQFPGGLYEHLFYVADVEANGPTVNGELHVALDRTDFLVVFPLRAQNRVRLIGTVRDEVTGKRTDLSWDDVGKRVVQWLRINVERVNWFSTYRVHHRVAGSFRHDRAFLLGDAAHIHSPVGGQGMNTGIGDASNLGWKLAAVVSGRANAALLDSYEPERIAFARSLVATTDRAFTGVTSSAPLAQFIRLRLAPLFAPLIFAFHAARRLMFRVVSQTRVNYRGSQLSKGRAGSVRGGDRLPWVQMTMIGDGKAHKPAGAAPDKRGTAADLGANRESVVRDSLKDNFETLQSLDWQIHVYGEATPAIRRLCHERHIPLHTFAWHWRMRKAGLRRNAAYLIRPDGYVAVADSRASAAVFASYLNERQIRSLVEAPQLLHQTS